MPSPTPLRAAPTQRDEAAGGRRTARSVGERHGGWVAMVVGEAEMDGEDGALVVMGRAAKLLAMMQAEQAAAR